MRLRTGWFRARRIPARQLDGWLPVRAVAILPSSQREESELDQELLSFAKILSACEINNIGCCFAQAIAIPGVSPPLLGLITVVRGFTNTYRGRWVMATF